MKLDGAKILITGGAGGIGSAIAAELLQAGASVMLADLNAPALDAVVARLAAGPDRLSSVAANLTQPEGRTKVCRAAAAWGIDALVNNAGVSHFGLHEELGPARVAQTIEINVLAPLLLVQELLPYLQSRPQAAILNMGSVFGNIGYPGYTAYSASKFAIRGFSEALRRELADTSVRVQYLAPRATRTPINSEAVERMNAELKVAMDAPATVASEVRKMLEAGTGSAVVGWPEKLFARINALLPGMVDGSIARQLPIIRRYAGKRAGPEVAGAGNHQTRRQTI